MDKKAQVESLNRETQKEVKRERQKLIIDFDQALREQRAEPIEVVFEGQTFELPPEAPAWLPLFLNRNQNEDGVVSDEANLRLIEKLLGKGLAERIMDSDNFISFTLINDSILQPVFNHWGLDMQDESGNEKTRS